MKFFQLFRKSFIVLGKYEKDSLNEVFKSFVVVNKFKLEDFKNLVSMEIIVGERNVIILDL